MNKERGFIANIAAILVVVALVFFSQQPAGKQLGANIQAFVGAQGNGAVAKFFSGINPKAGGEVSKFQASVSEKITEQKNNAAQNVWENIKKYFAGKFNKTFGTEVK